MSDRYKDDPAASDSRETDQDTSHLMEFSSESVSGNSIEQSVQEFPGDSNNMIKSNSALEMKTDLFPRDNKMMMQISALEINNSMASSSYYLMERNLNLLDQQLQQQLIQHEQCSPLSTHQQEHTGCLRRSAMHSRSREVTSVQQELVSCDVQQQQLWSPQNQFYSHSCQYPHQEHKHLYRDSQSQQWSHFHMGESQPGPANYSRTAVSIEDLQSRTNIDDVTTSRSEVCPFPDHPEIIHRTSANVHCAKHTPRTGLDCIRLQKSRRANDQSGEYFTPSTSNASTGSKIFQWTDAKISPFSRTPVSASSSSTIDYVTTTPMTSISSGVLSQPSTKRFRWTPALSVITRASSSPHVHAANCTGGCVHKGVSVPSFHTCISHCFTFPQTATSTSTTQTSPSNLTRGGSNGNRQAGVFCGKHFVTSAHQLDVPHSGTPLRQADASHGTILKPDDFTAGQVKPDECFIQLGGATISSLKRVAGEETEIGGFTLPGLKREAKGPSLQTWHGEANLGSETAVEPTHANMTGDGLFGMNQAFVRNQGTGNISHKGFECQPGVCKFGATNKEKSSQGITVRLDCTSKTGCSSRRHVCSGQKKGASYVCRKRYPASLRSSTQCKQLPLNITPISVLLMPHIPTHLLSTKKEGRQFDVGNIEMRACLETVTDRQPQEVCNVPDGPACKPMITKSQTFPIQTSDVPKTICGLYNQKASNDFRQNPSRCINPQVCAANSTDYSISGYIHKGVKLLPTSQHSKPKASTCHFGSTKLVSTHHAGFMSSSQVLCSGPGHHGTSHSAHAVSKQFPSDKNNHLPESDRTGSIATKTSHEACQQSLSQYPMESIMAQSSQQQCSKQLCSVIGTVKTNPTETIPSSSQVALKKRYIFGKQQQKLTTDSTEIGMTSRCRPQPSAINKTSRKINHDSVPKSVSQIPCQVPVTLDTYSCRSFASQGYKASTENQQLAPVSQIPNLMPVTMSQQTETYIVVILNSPPCDTATSGSQNVLDEETLLPVSAAIGKQNQIAASSTISPLVHAATSTVDSITGCMHRGVDLNQTVDSSRNDSSHCRTAVNSMNTENAALVQSSAGSNCIAQSTAHQENEADCTEKGSTTEALSSLLQDSGAAKNGANRQPNEHKHEESFADGKNIYVELIQQPEKIAKFEDIGKLEDTEDNAKVSDPGVISKCADPEDNTELVDSEVNPLVHAVTGTVNSTGCCMHQSIGAKPTELSDFSSDSESSSDPIEVIYRGLDQSAEDDKKQQLLTEQKEAVKNQHSEVVKDRERLQKMIPQQCEESTDAVYIGEGPKGPAYLVQLRGTNGMQLILPGNNVAVRGRQTKGLQKDEVVCIRPI